MDEHQLFEAALAATMNELDLAFYLKEEQKTALESFLCKKGVFASLASQTYIKMLGLATHHRHGSIRGADKRLSFKFPLHAIGQRYNQPERFPSSGAS